MRNRILATSLAFIAFCALGASGAWYRAFTAVSGYTRAEWYLDGSQTCGIAEALEDLYRYRDGGTVYLAASNLCSSITDGVVLDDIDGDGGPTGLILQGAGGGNPYITQSGSRLLWNGPSPNDTLVTLQITVGAADEATITRSDVGGDWIADGVSAGMMLGFADVNDRCPFTNPQNCDRLWYVNAVTSSTVLQVADPTDAAVAEGPIASITYRGSECMLYSKEWQRGLVLRDFDADGNASSVCFAAWRPSNLSADSQSGFLFQNVSPRNFKSIHTATAYYIEGRTFNDQWDQAIWMRGWIEAGRCIYINSKQAVVNQSFGSTCTATYRGIEVVRGEIDIHSLAYTALVPADWAIYLHSTAHRFNMFGGYFEIHKWGGGIHCESGRNRTTLLAGSRWYLGYLDDGTPRHWIQCLSEGPITVLSNVFEVNNSGLEGLIDVSNTTAYFESASAFIDETGALDRTIMGNGDLRSLPADNWKWMDHAGSASDAATW
jgi:hypothetical protein